MATAFFYVLLVFFAVYGIVSMIVGIMGMQIREKSEILDKHFVIMVKNAEDTIEEILRDEIWDIIHKNQTADIYLVDMGSEDGTLEIVKLLEKSYSFLHGVTMDQYINLLKGR